MSVLKKATIKNRIRKLNSAKSDLTDDGTAIRNYNSNIDSIISDFQSFVKSGNSAVVSRLGNYREPYQYNDGNLTAASNYIQSEINSLNRSLSIDSKNGSW